MVINGSIYRILEEVTRNDFVVLDFVVRKNKEYYRLSAFNDVADDVKALGEGKEVSVDYYISPKMYKKNDKEYFFTKLVASKVEIYKKPNAVEEQQELFEGNAKEKITEQPATEPEEDDIPF